MLLRALLVGICLYTPYQVYLGLDFGLKGINLFNMLFMAAAAVVLTDGTRVRAASPLVPHFTLLIVALTLGLVVSLTRGDAPLVDDVTYYKTAVSYLLLFFLFFHAVQDRATLKLVYGAVVFVAAVAALQAARQGLDYGLGNFNETRRAAGPFSRDWANSNRAGVFFAMFTPVFAAIALFYTPSRLARWIAAGCVALGVFATFVTYSRQAYGIAGVLLLCLLLRRHVLLAAIAGIAMLNYSAWVPESAIDRIEMTQSTSEDTGKKELDESAASRFVIWAGAADMIKESPWGVGLNRFKMEIGSHSAYKGKDAHNHYVLTAAELGLQGLFALLWLLFGLFGVSRPLFRLKDDPLALTLGYSHLLATGGLALGSIYGSPLYFGEATANYWVLTALAARYPMLVAAEVAAAPAVAGVTGSDPPPLATRTPRRRAAAGDRWRVRGDPG